MVEPKTKAKPKVKAKAKGKGKPKKKAKGNNKLPEIPIPDPEQPKKSLETRKKKADFDLANIDKSINLVPMQALKDISNAVSDLPVLTARLEGVTLFLPQPFLSSRRGIFESPVNFNCQGRWLVCCAARGPDESVRPVEAPT